MFSNLTDMVHILISNLFPETPESIKKHTKKKIHGQFLDLVVFFEHVKSFEYKIKLRFHSGSITQQIDVQPSSPLMTKFEEKKMSLNSKKNKV